MRITCITIDCHDPLAVARFWNEALRWGWVGGTEGGEGAVCGPSDGGMYLEFVRVPERKEIKNRMHLGCGVASLEELETEIDRLLDLGATIAWEEEFPSDIAAEYRNLVLRDIEGNEFCVGAASMPTS